VAGEGGGFRLSSLTVRGEAAPAPPAFWRRPGPLALIALLYTGGVTALMVVRRQVLTPDYLFILFIPVALASGRILAFLRDWAPLVALMLAWEGMRGLAFKAGNTVYEGTWQIEEALFGGRLPGVVLQQLARTLHITTWLDPAATALYFAHFPATLAFALALWFADRAVFLQFTLALVAMSFAAFLFFLLLPTAPPWWSAAHGDFGGLNRIFASTLQSRLDPLYVLIERVDPNPVAAIPSMHAAYPFLGFLALRKVWPRAGWIALGWAAAIWLAIVYLGEHYVVDAVVGIAWAAVFWGVVQWAVVPRTRALRPAASPLGPARERTALGEPDPAY
jgi:hypothetical protein